MYTVYHGPSGKTKSGFETKEYAEKYIEQHICSSCRLHLKEGGFFTYSEYFEVVTNVLQTSCGAEWEICLTSDLE